MKQVLLTEFGSTVYGTRVPTSDTDIKGIFIPYARDILLQRAPEVLSTNTKLDKAAKNLAEDIDKEVFALHAFIKLLMEGQTFALDMMFTPQKHWIGKRHWSWEALLDNRHRFLHSGTSAFAGYCQHQAAKYGVKGSRVAAIRSVLEELERLSAPPQARLYEHWNSLKIWGIGKEHVRFEEIKNPAGVAEEYLSVCGRKLNGHVTVKHALEIYRKIFAQYGQRALMAETNQGVDWKALMHAVRVCGEAQELLTTGNITFPRPNAKALFDIRTGKLPYKQVEELIEQGLKDLEAAKATTLLPKEPDRAFANDFVENVYKVSVVYPGTSF